MYGVFENVLINVIMLHKRGLTESLQIIQMNTRLKY